MLEYCDAYLEQNEQAIATLIAMMGPWAAQVALEMAPEPDAIGDDGDGGTAF